MSDIKFVVMVDNEYTVGPFNTKKEAVDYVSTDWESENLKIYELASPAQTED